MRIETIGRKRYLVVKNLASFSMNTEFKNYLQYQEGVELIDEYWFEKELILNKEKLAISDIIASVLTQLNWHDLGDDESRAEVLGQLKLLKTMILNSYNDEYERHVCFEEVEYRLGDCLESFGYDNFEDLF